MADNYLQEWRDVYPKELLTDEEFETAMNIKDKKERRNYVKQCLMCRNDYEGPKELGIYDDVWFGGIDD